MAAAPGPRAPAVEFAGIDKRFGPVHANQSIDLKIEAGTIHGIVGENGAGKSTLMKILGGAFPPDSGTIRLEDGTLLAPVAEGTAVTGAELLWAVRHEGALDEDDLLDRRTRIGLGPAGRARAPARRGPGPRQAAPATASGAASPPNVVIVSTSQ